LSDPERACQAKTSRVRFSARRSFLFKHQVHDPASPDVRSFGPTVGQNQVVIASRIHQRIGE